MLAVLFDRPYKKAITARLSGSSPHAEVPDGGRTEQNFIIAMFALLGRIAKLDGRVTQGEVSYASTIMTLMGMRAHQRRQAINYFEQGKLPNTDVMQFVFGRSGADRTEFTQDHEHIADVHNTVGHQIA